MRPLARLLDHAGVTAVVQRDVPVRLVNISRSGCLLMAPAAMRDGTVGRLRIVLDGISYVGDVRVVRGGAMNGRLRQVGVEFLWISMAEDASSSRAIGSG